MVVTVLPLKDKTASMSRGIDHSLYSQSHSHKHRTTHGIDKHRHGHKHKHRIKKKHTRPQPTSKSPVHCLQPSSVLAVFGVGLEDLPLSTFQHL